jgi:hypothetical protein
MASTRIEDLPDNNEQHSLTEEQIPEEELDLMLQEESFMTGNVKPKAKGKPDLFPFFWETYGDFIKNILLVLGILLLSSNNEVQKSIARFPLVKLQRTDFYFGILVSVLFIILYAILYVMIF